MWSLSTMIWVACLLPLVVITGVDALLPKPSRFWLWKRSLTVKIIGSLSRSSIRGIHQLQREWQIFSSTPGGLLASFSRLRSAHISYLQEQLLRGRKGCGCNGCSPIIPHFTHPGYRAWTINGHTYVQASHRTPVVHVIEGNVWVVGFRREHDGVFVPDSPAYMGSAPENGEVNVTVQL